MPASAARPFAGGRPRRGDLDALLSSGASRWRRRRRRTRPPTCAVPAPHCPRCRCAAAGAVRADGARTDGRGFANTSERFVAERRQALLDLLARLDGCHGPDLQGDLLFGALWLIAESARARCALRRRPLGHGAGIGPVPAPPGPELTGTRPGVLGKTGQCSRVGLPRPGWPAAVRILRVFTDCGCARSMLRRSYTSSPASPDLPSGAAPFSPIRPRVHDAPGCRPTRSSSATKTLRSRRPGPAACASRCCPRSPRRPAMRRPTARSRRAGAGRRAHRCRRGRARSSKPWARRARRAPWLFAEAAGEVVAVNFEPGARVREGEALLGLDARVERLA